MQQVTDALVAGATFEFPAVLVEREIDRMIREQGNMNDSRQAMDRYLATIGKTEEEYRGQFREEATERVKRSLALSQFVEDEGIEVTPEEVEADIERMATDAGLSGDQIREIFGGESGRDVIERSLLTRKAHDRMTEIAEGKELPPRPEKGETAATEAPVAQAAEAQPEAVAVAAESGEPASEAAAAEAEPEDSPAATLETTEEKDS